VTDDAEGDIRHVTSRVRPTRLTIGDLSDVIQPALNNLRWSEDLVAGWRRQLADATGLIQRSVANQITEALADLRLATIEVPGTDWSALIKSTLGTGLDAALAGYRDQIAELLRPAALFASRALTAEFAKMAGREREYLEALRKMGWWLPPSVDFSFYRQVGELAHQGKRQAVRDYMNDLADSTYFRRIVLGWMSLPAFAERKRFFLDGLGDHRRRRYRASIPTLLPHLEGIATATFAPGSGRIDVKGLLAEALAEQEVFMGDSLVSAVTLLWEYVPFGSLASGDRRLNRHAVLHGRSTGYGSQVNSTKVLFAFDLLASVVKEAEEAKATTKPVK
jgi:hypothetical protein